MQRNVVVVGDVMRDYTSTVTVRGVSPEDSSALVMNRVSDHVNVGGAGNVAMTCAALGSPTHMIGFNSDQGVHRRLEDAGVRCKFAKPSKGMTPLKQRIVTHVSGNLLMRVDTEENWEKGEDFWRNGGELQMAFRELALAETKPIVGIVNYDKGSVFPASLASMLASRHVVDDRFQVPMVVDPGRHGDWRPFGTAHTIFKANALQAAQFHQKECCNKNQYAPNEFGWTFRQSPGSCVQATESVRLTMRTNGILHCGLVLTFGPSGLVVAGKEPHQIVHVPAQEIRGADVCGAGDTVMATIMSSLAVDSEPTWWEALKGAAIESAKAANIAVHRRGVYVVTKGDMGWPVIRT